MEVAPYSMLSLYYDDVMAHVDYMEWADYALRVASKFDNNIKTVSDLACGTGTLAFEIAKRGYTVTGIDGCKEMVNEAKNTDIPVSWKVKFYTGDLRSSPPIKDQDLVLCLYDSINYLLEESDLEQFFKVVKNVVKKEGLLLIDCSTERNSLNYFDGYNDSELIGDAVIRRNAYYSVDDRIQHNEFEIIPESGTEIYYEHHRQRIWPIEYISYCLETNGFQILGIYDKYSIDPGSENSDRVHFISRLK